MNREQKPEERIMAEIGKNIALLRKQKNMTQEELASILHVSPQAVSKWENELSCPDIALLPQLAAVFGVSVDFLLGITPPTSESARAAAEPAESRSEPAPSAADTPPTEATGSPLREIRIQVIKPDGKTANIRLPIKVVRFGLGLGTTIGGLEREHAAAIEDAIRQGLRGEILHVTGENGETVTIVTE